MMSSLEWTIVDGKAVCQFESMDGLHFAFYIVQEGEAAIGERFGLSSGEVEVYEVATPEDVAKLSLQEDGWHIKAVVNGVPVMDMLYVPDSELENTIEAICVIVPPEDIVQYLVWFHREVL